MENQATHSRPVGRLETADPVKDQGILASLTRKERAAARLWKERWSFLSHDHVRKVHEEEALKLGLTLEQYHKGIKSVSCKLDPKLYPVEVDPSPHPVPRTSSGARKTRISDVVTYADVASGHAINKVTSAKRPVTAHFFKYPTQNECCKEPNTNYSGIVISDWWTDFDAFVLGMVGRRALCPLERYGRLVKTARDYPLYPLPPPGQLYDPYKQTLMYIGFEVGDPISYKLPPATSEVTDEMWAQPRQLQVAALCDSLKTLLEN